MCREEAKSDLDIMCLYSRGCLHNGLVRFRLTMFA